MSVRIYCDPMRDFDGNTIPGAARETRLRVMAIYRLVDRVLNPTTPKEIWMDDVKTIDHTRLGSIAIAEEPEGDGMLRGEVFYGVTITGYRSDL